MKEASDRLKPLERAPRPAAAGTDIGHVHLKTADIDRIHDFYVGVLGFDVVARMPDALFLSTGGYHHDLGFNTWHRVEARHRRRRQRGSFTWPSAIRRVPISATLSSA